jgi:hypothetical protein
VYGDRFFDGVLHEFHVSAPLKTSVHVTNGILLGPPRTSYHYHLKLFRHTEGTKTYAKPGVSLRKEGKIVNSEDVFFAWCVTDTGGKLPVVNVARDFSLESLYSDKPMAFHKVFWPTILEDFAVHHKNAKRQGDLTRELCTVLMVSH